MNKFFRVLCEQTVMKRSLRWDVDGDGIIDNSGFPDQTFDAWTVTGARWVNSESSHAIVLICYKYSVIQIMICKNCKLLCDTALQT